MEPTLNLSLTPWCSGWSLEEQARGMIASTESFWKYKQLNISSFLLANEGKTFILIVHGKLVFQSIYTLSGMLAQRSTTLYSVFHDIKICSSLSANPTFTNYLLINNIFTYILVR